ncbi:MAG: RNA polymerase sigma factor [Sphingomonas bacterium]|nr:RNA polymerase sigma factor [Sphingomonas bacterium]
MTAHPLQSLFLASRPALLRFLRSRGAATDEAEDLLQDLYLKLERQLASNITEPRAYLYRIADNLWLDRRRGTQSRARREEAWLDASFANTSPSSSIASDDALIAQEQLRLVAAALATLPTRTMEVFRRFRIDGERQKVIAADLGITVSAVEKHLQRAYEVVLAAKVRSDAEYDVPRRLTGESESDVV